MSEVKTMKLKNAVLRDLDGVELKLDPMDKSATPKMLTVAQVLLTCCLQPQPMGQTPRDAASVAKRYDAALMLNKVLSNQEFELDVDLVATLRADMLQIYPVITCGQMLPMLEGKH